MNFLDTNYAEQVKKTLELPQATFYFLEDLIIGEIDEGSHYNMKNALPLVKAAKDFYGKNAQIGYISNRVNNYTVSPRDWMNFYKENRYLKAVALVCYTPTKYSKGTFEKMFIPTQTKQFSCLETAILWARTKTRPNLDKSL
ncbi:hypothetical protein [Gilvibacter sp.]|uniref:hypothetical protein n=1 Tax=Gilvibacter sp. TaxID=2729997 RepID=UPI003F49C994